jgi:hypothetical protein
MRLAWHSLYRRRHISLMPRRDGALATVTRGLLPFLFLLTVRGMGGNLKWYHKLLIILGIVVNLVGVVAINLFPMQESRLKWQGT